MARTNIGCIGTRAPHEVDPDARWVFSAAVEAMVRLGHVVVTGAAIGFDQIALSKAAEYRGRAIAVLPWASYERTWLDQLEAMYPGFLLHRIVYDPARHLDWTKSVHDYHPMARHLSRGAFALHARNYGIVELSRAIMALPSASGGGTMQGIRIATGKMPVFDLRRIEDREAVWQYLERLGHATE